MKPRGVQPMHPARPHDGSPRGSPLAPLLFRRGSPPRPRSRERVKSSKGGRRRVEAESGMPAKWHLGKLRRHGPGSQTLPSLGNSPAAADLPTWAPGPQGAVGVQGCAPRPAKTAK
jgi:hypothetical protein